MSYVKMLIHESALHDFVDKVGTMDNVQFTDVGLFVLVNLLFLVEL